jgi:transposase
MILSPEDPRQLEFCCRADVLTDEPLIKVVDDIVSGLDLRELYSRYHEGGRAFFDPGMQLKVLFFSYCDGVRSCREIAKHIRYDVRYRYFCGSLRPDFRTINRFRKDNLDLLGEYFAQVVLLCREQGLIDASLLALDGTKIRASASGRKKRRQQLSEVFQARLKEDVVADNLDDDEGGDDQNGDEAVVRTGTNQVESSDPDARFMKTSEGGLRLSYNSQVVVDREQFIIAADVSNNADDSVQFQSMMQQSERVLGGPPERVVVDGGYYSGANVSYGVSRGIDLYLPVTRTGRVPDACFHRDAFMYDVSHDRYRCPAGEFVTYQKTRRRRGIRVRIYRGCAATCGKCALRQRCTKYRYRRLEISEHYSHERAMQAKLGGIEGRRIYDQRKQLVEPVFGNLKFNLGFVRYALRTLDKVKGEFLLMCLAHNLKKLAALGTFSPRRAISFLTFTTRAILWFKSALPRLIRTRYPICCCSISS